MMTPTCETCRFFNRENDWQQHGQCRANPPQIVLEMRNEWEYGHDERIWTTYKTVEWPEVPKDEWCGTHQPKRAEPESGN
jgi:hypothetical protein